MSASVHLERFLLTLWVGGMWVIGFVAAPLLFQHAASPAIAGALAGKLFAAMHVIGLIAGPVLLLIAFVLDRPRRRLRLGLIGAMLVLTAVAQYGLGPTMQDLRQSAGGIFVPGSIEQARFATLHGVSTVLYIANSVLGLVLVLLPSVRPAFR